MIELLITGAVIFMVLLVLLPIVRRQKTESGKLPRYIWILVVVALVVVVVLTIYSLSRPR